MEKTRTYRFVIALVLIAVISVIGIFISVKPAYAATAYTESEPNDYIGSADMISMSGENTFNGTLSDVNDADYIKFTLSKGSKITLDVYGSRPINPDLDHISYSFYKAENTSLDFYYNNAPYDPYLGYLHEKEDVYLSAGTYYLRLEEGFMDEKINYTLTFKTTEWENFKEPNDYMGQATEITDGKVYQGMVESYSNFRTSREVDWFKIKTQEKGKYYITVENIDAEYFTISAVDSNGEDQYIFDDSYYLSVGEKESAKKLVTLPKGTMYFRTWEGCGRYKFSVTKKPLKQTISGAKTFNKTYGNKAFSLKAKAKGKLSYKSSNTKVASVSSTGKVTIKGTGKATITVTAAATGNYAKTTKSVTVKVAPKKVASLKAKAGKKKMTVSWKKDTRATGYQIVIARNIKFTKDKKIITLKRNSTIKQTIGKLKSKKMYYVKVRAYKKSGGIRIYGNYSTVRKVKVR